MSKCQTKKLGDICDIQSGGTPSRSKNEYWVHGTIPWVKISDINSKFINKTEELITEFGLENSSAKIFTKGTIIYTIFATIGEVAILNCNACTNQAIAGIKILNNNVSTEYLYHYLVHKKEEVKALSRGVAQNNINLTLLRALEIDIPVASEQKMKSEVLNKVCSIIEARKIQLLELDKLAKSRFIEMFGDPVLNPYGFEVKNMGEVCTFYTGTGFPNVFQGKSDGDFPFYKVGDISKNVQNGFKELEYCDNYINKDVVDKIRGTIIPSGTIVFAKIGEALKLNRRGLTIKNCLVDNNVMGVKPKEELNISYFFQLMKDLDMEKYSASTTVPSVRKTILERIPILVPNLDIQNKYAEFIKQLDKSKFRIKKSLEKLELTYKALLQEYFG